MSATAKRSRDPESLAAEAQGTWASVAHAVTSCKKSDLPEPEELEVFERISATREFYEEHKDDTSVFGVHIYGINKEHKVPFAVVDLATHSDWLAAYLKNRQVILHESFPTTLISGIWI